jgi:hypothetical protein
MNPHLMKFGAPQFDGVEAVPELVSNMSLLHTADRALQEFAHRHRPFVGLAALLIRQSKLILPHVEFDARDLLASDREEVREIIEGLQ